jgi:hypothetical protein
MPAVLIAAGAGALFHMLLTNKLYVAVPAMIVPVLCCHAVYARWSRRIASRSAPALATT